MSQCWARPLQREGNVNWDLTKCLFSDQSTQSTGKTNSLCKKAEEFYVLRKLRCKHSGLRYGNIYHSVLSIQHHSGEAVATHFVELPCYKACVLAIRRHIHFDAFFAKMMGGLSSSANKIFS